MAGIIARAATASGTSGSEKVVDVQNINGVSSGGVSIGSYGAIIVGSETNCLVYNSSYGGSMIYPANAAGAIRDDVIDLGSLSSRFDDIYATNGTIQTSDRNEKQDIEELSEAERRVAQACKGLLRKFRWKSAVADKGEEARVHFGIIAQDLEDAFTSEGLDAGKYAMFIKSSWEDETTKEQRTRLGVRYSELLAFIIAAL